MLSALPSVVALGVVMWIAARLAGSRPSHAGLVQERDRASRALAIATTVQAVHFVEEWATGFHASFPGLFGQEPMPLWLFVGFNLACLAAWGASVPVLQSAQKLAFGAAWFLALAAMLNGIAHPIMAIVTAGYFPGLVTSPLIGLGGLYLWQQLTRTTSTESAIDP